MSLASNVALLAAAIRDKFNAIQPRLVPAGGAKGFHFAKNSATNYDTGWSAPFDSRATISAFTDFLSRAATQDVFTITAVNAGTFATPPAAGLADGNHPGIVLLRNATTANGGVRIQTEIDVLRLAGGEVFECVFRLPAALVTTATYRLGFHDATTSADAVDGAYIEIVSGTATAKTASNSVRTSAATTVVLSANTWYHARITVNANATSVLYEIFSDTGGAVWSQTVAANIPTASGRELGAGIIATSSAVVAADLVNVDWISMDSTRTLIRGA